LVRLVSIVAAAVLVVEIFMQAATLCNETLCVSSSFDILSTINSHEYFQKLERDLPQRF